MATIKPIEGKSVHQIQSGQVIVDLTSVVKELVENSLDAGATSVEVRLKNQGLDSIEVQDNGSGIAPEDYSSIALKHYTSKLSSYDDISALQTFGFRGEALSSLCALSNFHILTARAEDGPKGSRLDFETSGKLKSTTIVASTKGTTVVVENIFNNLPVRKRELEKNVRREYSKVLSQLHSYACISTGVKFVVSNQMPKSKKTVIFSTKANPTAKENIANVYGAKTLVALVPLDMKFEMQSSTGGTQSLRIHTTHDDQRSRDVEILGHISRPVVGEGRQTPDRQMFFVNSRPCNLPQVTKAFNEVYKSYNITQSPFIFANFKMNTTSYDVNVSPDKKTILLHDQTALLDSLKASLVKLFESQDQSVPQSSFLPSAKKLPAYKPLSLALRDPTNGTVSESPDVEEERSIRTPMRQMGRTDSSLASRQQSGQPEMPVRLIQSFVGRNSEARTVSRSPSHGASIANDTGAEKQHRARSISLQEPRPQDSSEGEDGGSRQVSPTRQPLRTQSPIGGSPMYGLGLIPELPTDSNGQESVADFNARVAEEHAKLLRMNSSSSMPFSPNREEEIQAIKQTPQKYTPGTIQSAFDRMRPKRVPQEVATITIGDQTTVTTIGDTPYKRRRIHTPKDQRPEKDSRSPLLLKSLRGFAAPGSRFPSSQAEDDEEPSDAGEDIASFSLPVTSWDGVICEDKKISLREAEDEGTGYASDEEHEAEEDTNDAKLSGEDSDDECMDERTKKAKEDARVAKLIAEAEAKAARPSADNLKRATRVLKGPARKYSTLDWEQKMPLELSAIQTMIVRLHEMCRTTNTTESGKETEEDSLFVQTAEERLSLTVSKGDFLRMRIVGQFNLGFILAVRPGHDTIQDELFIIDQHASDEKYNFERLSATTILTPQRLVHPHTLTLTAIEEEIIENNDNALTANGFQITTDKSGQLAVGSRCSLLTLPTSREVTFTPADLEELLVLLGDKVGNDIPRPAKVRKLLAMRACRGSVMVGKTMTRLQMERIVKHMGELEKPWNCPHGRPTMRHLYGMDAWERWKESDGIWGLEETSEQTDWRSFIQAAPE